MQSKKKVLIVDNYPICREGMTRILAAESLSVCGQAASSDEALSMIEKEQPDLVIMDIGLRDSNGIDLIKSAKAVQEELNVLVFSALDETIYAERAMQAGAKGYVMKQVPVVELTNAIKRIFAGKIYLSPVMTEKMLQRRSEGMDADTSPIDTLSDRELEVFHLIGEGKPTTNIARCLHLSIKTIETYRAKIKQKLNLTNNTELIRHAFQWLQTAQTAA